MRYNDIDIEQIRNEGKLAFQQKLELDSCPYREDSLAESAWIDGWQDVFYNTLNESSTVLDEQYDNPDHFFLRYSWIEDSGDIIEEAVYAGRIVPLRKVMKGDTKRHKVYVNSGRKNKDGQVIAKKVEFGSPHGSKLRIRKSSKGRRKSFAARHHCSTAKDPKTARYWSCRAPSSNSKGGYW